MFGLALLLIGAPTVPADPPDLADAHRFGVASGCAIQNARLAYGHPDAMRDEVRSWNPPDVFAQWERECEWRSECWNALAAATDGQMVYKPYEPCGEAADTTRVAVLEGLDSYSRRFYLGRLRQLLGDEAFDAGLMPDPLPNYRR